MITYFEIKDIYFYEILIRPPPNYLLKIENKAIIER
jgi:hypothetical protein